jgi:hypothetical protein
LLYKDFYVQNKTMDTTELFTFVVVGVGGPVFNIISKTADF